MACLLFFIPLILVLTPINSCTSSCSFSYFILPTQVLQTLNSSTLLLTFLYIIFPLQVLQSLHSSASFPFTFRSFLFVFLFFRTHICILFAPLKSPLFPTDTDNCHTRHGIFLLDLTIRLLFLSKYYPDRIGILNC